jgi:hypothetical protein
MSELGMLHAQLHAYRDFDECVVLDLKWFDWLTSLQVDLDFIWQDNGRVRTQLDDRRIVSIRFFGVSELRVIADLADEMVGDDSLLGWGFGEIACLRVEQGKPPRSRLTSPSYKASFRREGYTWIEITFLRWEFSESAQRADQSPLNSD